MCHGQVAWACVPLAMPHVEEGLRSTIDAYNSATEHLGMQGFAWVLQLWSMELRVRTLEAANPALLTTGHRQGQALRLGSLTGPAAGPHTQVR